MKTIARGIFQWDAGERRSDRYGTFVICAHDEDTNVVVGTGEKVVHSDWKADDKHAFMDTEKLSALVGKHVRITAKVIETRKSRHVGDLYRNIFPKTPKLGAVIDLGTGTLFIERSTWDTGECCGDVFIGLRPDDGRSKDWFDPRKLYQLHTQTVEITVAPVAVSETQPKRRRKRECDGVIYMPAGDSSYQKKQTFH